MTDAPSTPVDLAAPDGTPLTVCAPGGGRAPRGGVVVVHDARGITPYLRSVCARLAEAGWLAAAPHLYHRQGITETPAAGGWPSAAQDMLVFTGAGLAADVDAALGHLAAAGAGDDRRAIVGFCMGGTVALATATRRPLAAAISFYGGAVTTPYWDGVPPLAELAPSLKGPWLGLYGEEDPLISLDEIKALRAAAARAAVPTELVSYPGAGHAFHSDDRAAVYRPDAAADAWARALAFLDSHLGHDSHLA
ncbi:dienelactone hydrolase family protein [Frankia sp. CNm7]|uniref:Dienelactone hydrolase family protein n=1 Tax=Frankia nepalensis TaxID=1836974 RepID=A0A937RBN2_9ACTN|nr:dienelactone hydrolase family protein [Frankia nepalensis]MBL7502547.1 dienelactone hydrolase family protein [Frankia nepalensis]MBL7511735.1 dienelactone hydrolase family protein [Frankia nepalensis]MBL7524733.1 dienelactone hydrolase family protein [Frankia nepalensis]MBL7629121.1 dienelactone hydrolase family protein [Frankia nepalensis]